MTTAPELSESLVAELRRALLTWYRDHRRALPWRGHPDPYAVWVSEIMLQQTRVDVVRPYFERWMARFPTVTALAEAARDEVLGAWQGLGYYSRARKLHEAAALVVRDHGGSLPRDVAALRALPGVGPYSAGAIASIAFGEAVPLVDGNVVRVLTRWFAIDAPAEAAATQRALWSLAARLVPQGAAGDFNQALMELGATVCSPRRPGCGRCPVEAHCRAARGEPERFPVLRRAAATRAVQSSVLVLRAGPHVLLERQPEGARWWAGLDAFPWAPTDGLPDAASAAIAARALLRRAPGTVRARAGAPQALGAPLTHTITRHRLTLTAWLVEVRGVAAAPPSPVEGAPGQTALRWVDGAALEAAALPAPHRKLAARLEPVRPRRPLQRAK